MYQNIQFKRHHLKPWGLEIVNKYPLIFLETDDEILYYTKGYTDEERVNLRFGFEHGEGWAKLIEDLASTGTDLVNFLRATGRSPKDTYIHGFICKEKLGTLAWQGNWSLPDPFGKLWRAYTNEIESKSARTCEITGKYGQVCVRGGWLKTLCEEEALKQEYKPYKRQ